MLLEREAELQAVEALLAGAKQGSGGALLIEGAPGIGKTSLFLAAVEIARAQQFTALAARAGELERDFPGGLARDLFTPCLASLGASDRAEILSGAAGLAAAVIAPDGVEASAPIASDRASAVVHGMFWVAANLTNRRPLLLAIDDGHWADALTLRFLVYLSHRLEGLPLALILTTRPAERASERGALVEIAANAGTLTPAPLSEQAVERLLSRSLNAEIDPRFASVAHEITGGNPFLLSELADVVSADRITPSAASASLLHDLGPRTVARSTLLRLSRLSSPGAELARAIAVLGATAAIRHAAALAEVDERTAAQAADALRGAHVLKAGAALEFEHPLVRSAIYADIPHGKRSLLHRRAADLLVGEGAPARSAAVHLLASEPAADPLVVEQLRRAALEALAGGAPEAAIDFLRRALAEPPSPDRRGDVLLELGRAEAIGRDPAAVAHLQAAREASADPTRRAEVAHDLAELLVFAGDITGGRALALEAISELGDLDSALSIRLWTLWGAASYVSVDGIADYEQRVPFLRELAETEVRETRQLQILLAVSDVLRAFDPAAALDRVDAGLDGGRFLADHGSEAWPLSQAVATMVGVEEYQRALDLTEAMLDDARTRGSILGFAAGSAHRGYVLCKLGDLVGAEGEMRAALALAMEHQLFFTIPFIFGYHAEVLRDRAGVDDLAGIVDALPLPPDHLGSAMIHVARGQRRWYDGRTEDAVADLREGGRIWDGVGLRNPITSAWRSALALALGSNSTDAVDLAEEELRMGEALGSRRAIGVSLRALGLLHRGPRGLELLAQAIEQHEQAAAPLELAHSLLALGASLRRGNRRADARVPLRRALDLAVRCGASRLAARVTEELHAAGGRPRSPLQTGIEALTPSERRVAELAAAGLTNPQIAQALFITLNTVESHLRSTYRKLDVRSRHDLPVELRKPRA